MPVTRVKKSTGTAGSKIPKPAKVSSENQVRGGRSSRSRPRTSRQPGMLTTIRALVSCRKKDSR